MKPVAIFAIVILLVTVCTLLLVLRGNSCPDKECRLTLESINRECCGNAGKLIKEWSVKLNRNTKELNGSRFVWVLLIPTGTLTRQSYRRMLALTGMGSAYQQEFPNVTPEDVNEIILGRNRSLKKMYLRVINTLYAIECNSKACKRKVYQRLDRVPELRRLDPSGLLHRKFSHHPGWKIQTPTGTVFHLHLTTGNEPSPYRLQGDSPLRKWLSIDKDTWEKIIKVATKKISVPRVYLVGLGNGFTTFYYRNG